MITPALIAAIMASGSNGGVVCPSYLTVTLSLTVTPYAPPTTGITLQLLPCPYTPPLV